MKIKPRPFYRLNFSAREFDFACFAAARIRATAALEMARTLRITDHPEHARSALADARQHGSEARRAWSHIISTEPA